MTCLRGQVALPSAVLLSVLLVLTPAACAAEGRQEGDGLERFHLTHRAMGTEFSLELYASNSSEAEQISDLAFNEVDRLETLLSNYRPTSELSRISRQGAARTVFTDPETFRFLERSQFWSRESGGAFDITVGPLLRAWGFFFNTGRVPSQAELLRMRRRIGWQRVQLDRETRSVRLRARGAMELDPGSIGKGFAVDRVVALLREYGVRTALLSAGNSTVYGMGSPPGGRGWPVHIPNPSRADREAGTVWLKDTSLSTGACTEKFFIKDGHRYCHIFDPRTMRPVEDTLQTTVIDPSATDSDALSTVMFVLPPERSSGLIDRAAGRSALIFRSGLSGKQCIALHWPEPVCAVAAQAKDAP